MQGVRLFQIQDLTRNIAQILAFNLREQKPDKRQQIEINTRQHAAHTGSQDEEFNQLVFPNRVLTTCQAFSSYGYTIILSQSHITEDTMQRSKTCRSETHD